MGIIKHGLSDTRLYRIWNKMLSRCDNTNDPNYIRYGNRGISICKQWYDINIFYHWAINNGYSDDLSIERIDNNGNYEPNNCKWANKIEQANNRRTNRIIEYNGKKQTLMQWSNELNISPSTILARFKLNPSIEFAFTKPVKQLKDRIYTYNNKTHDISEWARIVGIQKGTLYKRLLQQGWSIEKALTTPVNYKKLLDK